MPMNILSIQHVQRSIKIESLMGATPAATKSQSFSISCMGRFPGYVFGRCEVNCIEWSPFLNRLRSYGDSQVLQFVVERNLFLPNLQKFFSGFGGFAAALYGVEADTHILIQVPAQGGVGFEQHFQDSEQVALFQIGVEQPLLETVADDPCVQRRGLDDLHQVVAQAVQFEPFAAGEIDQYAGELVGHQLS